MAPRLGSAAGTAPCRAEAIHKTSLHGYAPVGREPFIAHAQTVARGTVTRSNQSRQVVSLAGCAALLYALLLVLGSGCGLTHADHAQRHQHHHGEDASSSQGAFCAWVCQSTVETIMALAPPTPHTKFVIGSADWVTRWVVRSTRATPDRSRAPPSASLLSRG